MRRHAKASSAGSNIRRGSRLGLNVRGAFATHESSSPTSGTGALTHFLIAALAACALALGPTQALAGTAFLSAGSLDGTATANGSFSQLLSESVAVNGKNGHILVADSGLGLVYDYDSPAAWDGSATPAGSFGSGHVAIAVYDETGDVYVADATHAVIDKFDETGNLIASFGDTTPSPEGQLSGAATPAGSFAPAAATSFGIAVDQQNGDLYVIDAGHSVIDVFDSTGAYQSQVTENPGPLFGFGGAYADGIAVNDKNSHLYISDSGPERVFEFDLAGNFLATLNGSATPAGSFSEYVSIAAANASGEFYVSETSHGVVDAFDQAGAYLRQITGFAEPRGIAVDQASGELYISDNSSGAGTVRIFERAEVDPPTITIDPVTTFTADSAHFSGTINPEAPSGSPAAFDVTYHFHCDPECPGLQGDRVAAAGETAEVVTDEATDLEPNTAYQVSLIASNAGGQAPAANVSFTTDTTAPTVSPATSTASEDSAVLHARLNPKNSATTFHFEYGPSASYGSTSPEVSGGSGGKTVIVGQSLKSLQPNSTYHYRILATNSAGTAVGPDRTVTIGLGFGENRAYEMVSPPQKLANDVMIAGSRTRAAVDGGAVQFLSLGASGDAKGTGITTEFMAVRTAEGWKTHSITPLHSPQPIGEALAVFDPRYVAELSPDLSAGVYASKTPLTGATNLLGTPGLYLRRDLRQPGPGSYELLTDPVAPILPGFGSGSSHFAASTDLSHLIFSSNLPLTSDAPAQPFPDFCASFNLCERVLYEHTPAGTRLVGKVPVAPQTTCTGTDCVVAPRAFPGRTLNATHYATDTISADGRRIYFTVAGSQFGDVGPLYLREDGATTIQVNVSELATPDEPQPARFWNASSDGSKAFFTTTERLLDEDTGGIDLYLWDREAAQGQRLTLVSATDLPHEVENVFGASDDASYVYFPSLSQLLPGAPPIPPGEWGVFSWHQGELAFVGVTRSQDSSSNVPNSWALSLQESRVTPDGEHFSFLSSSANQPTGDSSELCPGTADPCSRLYVYSAEADGGEGELACASCKPDGTPSSASVLVVPRVGTGGATSTSHLSRAITDDGRLVFFSTAERLVPDDVNGRVDAYSYDTVAGQPRLISTGRANDDSYFLEATPDGSDVYFATRERLVGWDVDNLIDIYDARLGGGLPEPSPPPPSCQGDACQPPPIVLTHPGLATSTSRGPGNLRATRPRRCPRGKRKLTVRAKAHCVKKGSKTKTRAASGRRPIR